MSKLSKNLMSYKVINIISETRVIQLCDPLYVILYMICILYCFPCEMEFSHHESPNRNRRQVVRNPSHMENHAHAFSRILCTFVMINTLRKVKDHENHVRWIYLKTVLYIGGNQTHARICV